MIIGSDHRSVPLEVLREFARSQAELTSLRNAAEEAGISKSTLHKFVMAGTMPHPRVRRQLALWYLRRLEGVDEIELIRPYNAALAVLLAEVPMPSRDRVGVDVLETIGRGFAAEGEEMPRWLDVILQRMSRSRPLTGCDSPTPISGAR